MKHFTTPILLSALMLAPVALWAAEAAPAATPPAMPAIAAQAQPAMEAVKTFSGGVGEEGLSKIKEIEKDYSLKLVFSDKEGSYLADVDVIIADKAGKELVHETTHGPVLLAALPAGKYTITASLDKATQSIKTRIGTKGLRTLEVHMPMVSE